MSKIAKFIISPEAGRCRVGTVGLNVERSKADTLSAKLRSYDFMREVVYQDFGSSNTWLLTVKDIVPSDAELARVVQDIEEALEVKAEFWDIHKPISRQEWADHMKQGLPG